MESKDPVPRLYLRIAGVDLEETRATEDGEAKPPLLWSMGAVLLSGSFALTLACGPPPDEGTTVAPMAVVNRTEGACEIDGGVPGVSGDGGVDSCTGGTGNDVTSTGTTTTGDTTTTTGKDLTSTGTTTTGNSMKGHEIRSRLQL